MFYKLLTIGVAIALLWQMFRLGQLGRKLALARTDYELSSHRSAVACVGCLTVLAVILIEAQVRMSPNPYASDPLLMAFHFLVVGLLSVVFFTIVLRFTGVKSPTWHGRLAYSFFVLYALAAATGTIMLYELPAPK